MGKVDIVEHGLSFGMIQFPKVKSQCDIEAFREKQC